MKIHLKPVGDLRDYFGRDPQALELPAGSSLQNLMALIGGRWGEQLPPYLWDAHKNRFRGAVYFLMDGQVVLDPDTALVDGGEIVVMRALAGG